MRLTRRDLIAGALGAAVALAAVAAPRPSWRPTASAGPVAASSISEPISPSSLNTQDPSEDGSTPSPTPSPSASAEGVLPGEPFVATFDGDPSEPTPWDGASWDVAVHSRDRSTWLELDPVEAHHGTNCEPPLESHLVTAYEDAVYACKGHIMTAMEAGGYGAIYLTPDHMVDFSEEGVVRFDVSTLRDSSRDWVDLWITPYEDNLVLPLGRFFPDLSGPPANAMQVRMAGKNRFEVVIFRDHEPEVHVQDWRVIEDVVELSATERQTFELRISNDRVRFGMPAHDLWWVDAEVGEIPFDRGVIQLGHHSYNPTKNGGRSNTWHWDNVVVDPAVPFTNIGADQRYITSEGPTTIVLDQPAPADAHLRFSGMGESFEVSFNGGSTWETAQAPTQIKAGGMLHRNYWTPVREGTTSVEVRGTAGWVRDWIAKDFAVWSPNVPGE